MDNFYNQKKEINLSYKYGKLYAINLMIDKDQKDLDALKSLEENSSKAENLIEAKEIELENNKKDRYNIYKELSEIDRDV